MGLRITSGALPKPTKEKVAEQMDAIGRVVRMAAIVLGVFVLASLSLVASNTMLLVFERRVIPGEEYRVEGYGNLGESTQASLVCTYFTGMTFRVRVYWYAADNIIGRDSCPVAG
jgi:hypothetical protein